MNSQRRKHAPIAKAASTAVLAGWLLIASTSAEAQFLLKDGQGLAGAPQAVPEAPKEDNATSPVQKLPEVKVEGELDPLSEGDRKRRNQIKQLPGLGTDQERELDRLEKLRAWYESLPKDANNLTNEQKAFLETQKDFDAKPDSRPGVPPVLGERRNPADYRDPIKAVSP
ncbi:MAG: hypothetical protein C0434_14320 [Xanthomonadaceae bacterium]|nr:hypothetical protein [Xanthomonadaceae bacterium]